MASESEMGDARWGWLDGMGWKGRDDRLGERKGRVGGEVVEVMGGENGELRGCG